jgi:hypothetical protein
MTQDEIIEMLAKVYGVAWTSKAQLRDLTAFAKLVAQHEREACAKVVEAWSDWHGGTETLAKAIRARGQA